MAGTAASCKSQNVNLISSPLNGGLMEQESPVVVRVLDGTHPMQKALSYKSVHACFALADTGGQA